MSILKSLFGKKTPEDEEVKEEKIDRAWRAPRVKLLPLHNIAFRPKNSQLGSKLEIANLSVSGVGFFKKSSVTWPEDGEIVEGEFDLDGQAYPARIRIVHQFGNVVGGAFEGGLHELSRMVMKYFEVELAALNTIEVNPEVLQEEDRGAGRWFRGEDNCELYVTQEGDQLVSFSMTFFGNYIEGGRGRPLKVGLLVEDEEPSQKPRYKGASIIKYQSTVQEGLVDSAVKFVENIEQLDFQMRVKIIELLRKR